MAVPTKEVLAEDDSGEGPPTLSQYLISHIIMKMKNKSTRVHAEETYLWRVR